MKIITTPMCEDVLRIAGLEDFEVVKPTEIRDADVAVLLSETKSDIPKISIKLNTYTQVYESVIKIQEEFNTVAENSQLKIIDRYILNNNEKKAYRKKTKVKVYSNFLRDIILDMGFTINDDEYDFIVIPDYMNLKSENENVIIVPSHKNVSSNIINRVKQRYELLERKLCMKQ